ncbi:MAG: bifunctional D-glycero-beta-D-manno-heptose-7-phosphate kinase/D-glycero-beta-D-manno-heptose 1-phosphate adenylyltransferase HldE [Desulfuromonadales bacterium]|nr:bifunctional D-glycero-beta-D-manno-heptose-7-phosphate kinase/D-glycero-beta-D-manno-heptose 1-phosphate adenylyltransferase HldE [Desulfuromonadales bacterium]
MDRKTIESLFNHIDSIRCLVIGDLMLDVYLWGKAERISPEAPVQVVDVLREEMRLGGAGNVVNNLVALGAQVAVCSVVGEDENGRTLLEDFNNRKVAVDAIFRDPARRTSRKTRVVASHQQIVRIDRESRDPLSEEIESKLCAWITHHAASFNVILLSDYLKGVLTQRVIDTVIAAAGTASIPVLVDPKGADFTRYHGATILTPNRKEAEVASGISIRDSESLGQAAGLIMEQVGLENLLITRSEEGMSLFSHGGETVHIPTVAREVFDVSGAGDTVLASLAVGVAAGLGMSEAARLANIAAGIAVGKLGTSTVSPAEIINAVALTHSDSDTKIKNRDVLTAVITAEKARGKRIVFTNGCFDLLHAGHVKYLQKARSLGDLLVLGLNSDASVRRLKGDKRPLIGEEERAHILAALDCIDYVVLFDEDTPLELIKALKPHILAKGGDYTADGVVGKDVVEAYGGRVELVSFVDGKSTTNIIERILERYA